MSVDSARKLAARSLRYFPKAKIAARRLDRGLTGQVDRVWQELQQQRAPLRRVTLALSGEAVADARFAAILDGRTLNIDIPVPRLPAGEVLSAELRAVHGSDRRAIPARVRTEPDGSVSIEATALLDDNPGGLALRPGRQWLRVGQAAVGDDALDQIGVDRRRSLEKRGEERIVGEDDLGAGDAVRMEVEPVDGGVGEGEGFAAGDHPAMFEHRRTLPRRQRLQGRRHRRPVDEIAVTGVLQPAPEFLLGEEDDLEKLLVVGFVVHQLAQEFQERSA